MKKVSEERNSKEPGLPHKSAGNREKFDHKNVRLTERKNK
jgi:hypothetical protein